MIAALRRRLPFIGLGGAATRTRIGLQFRGDQLALAQVTVDDKGAPRIERLAWTLAEAARRTEAIRRLAYSGLLRDAQVSIALSPGDYDVHQIQAPNVPAEELRDALRWQLRSTLPYAPEEAAIDFVRIPPPAATSDVPARPALLVVAAPRATIEQSVAPFITAGVDVHAVDIPEFAQRNLALLGPAPTDATGSVAWLSFDHDACLLTVQTRAGDICFTRRIHVAGANGRSDAIETDHTVGYLLERIATQVQRSLDVFERQSGQPTVTILTVGPHRHAAMIASELAQRLSIDAAVFEPARLFALTAEAPNADSPMWTDGLAALGVALRTDTAAMAAPRGSIASALASAFGSWRRAA